MKTTMAKKPERARAGQKSKVLLVDDHPLLREGIAHRINQEREFTVCGEAGSPREAMEAIPRLQPHVAVVDISLGDYSGIELLKDIRARHPTLPVLVLSMHDESLYAERALQAGAKGYLMKSEPPAEIIAALRHILAGQVHLSKRMTERMLQRIADHGPNAAQGFDRLTDRELEIMELMGQGRKTRQIAETLHLSAKTVASHRENIKQKLDLKDSAELMVRAVQWARDRHMI